MKTIHVLLLSFSLFLLALNIIGQFTNLRNDNIYAQSLNNRFDIELSEAEFHTQLNVIHESTLTDSSKIIATTELINRGMAHFWDIPQMKDFNIVIPVYENYLIAAMSRIMPEKFWDFEFMDWRKGLERGVGLCSQHALIEAGIFQERGIPSKLIGLDGHIVLTAPVGDQNWFVLDPDFGVVLPFSLAAIEDHPAIIKPYYEAAGYDAAMVNLLSNIYGKEGNHLINNAAEYKGWKGIFESYSYFAIWIFPLLMNFPFLFHKLNFGGFAVPSIRPQEVAAPNLQLENTY